MFPNLAEMGSPNGQIGFVSSICDPRINEALSRRRVEILPLVAVNYYFSFCYLLNCTVG